MNRDCRMGVYFEKDIIHKNKAVLHKDLCYIFTPVPGTSMTSRNVPMR